MAFDIDETKGRIATLKAKEARKKHRAAATAKGFKRLEDYDAWLALEELARETRIARGPASGGTIHINNIKGPRGITVSGSLTDFA